MSDDHREALNRNWRPTKRRKGGEKLKRRESAAAERIGPDGAVFGLSQVSLWDGIGGSDGR